MQPITEIVEGQEISTNVLNAWIKKLFYSYGELEGAIRIVKRITEDSFFIYKEYPDQIDLKLEGFVNFYNKFYNLTSDFRSTKLQVTPAQSALVQKKLFELGYRWSSSSKTVDNTAQPYLFINFNKLLTYGSSESYFTSSEFYFNSNKFKLITVEDILGYTPVDISLDWPKSINSCNEISGPRRSAVLPEDFKVYSPNFETSLQILAKMQELRGKYWKHGTFNNHNEVYWSLEGGHIVYTTIKSTFDKWAIPELTYQSLLNVNSQLPKDFEVYAPYEVHGQIIAKLRQLGGVLEDNEGRKPSLNCWWIIDDNKIDWSYSKITTYLPVVCYTELLNIKTNKQENEHIIVPTTIATITGGQKHTGTVISGRTRKATITVRHLSNRSISA